MNKDFADHLEVVPAVAGLHVAALARSASVDQISDVAVSASALGVEIQRLAKFAVDGPPRPGCSSATARSQHLAFTKGYRYCDRASMIDASIWLRVWAYSIIFEIELRIKLLLVKWDYQKQR